MEETGEFTDPRLRCTLSLPPGWQVDDSGVDQGILLASDPRPWGMGFHPNIAMTQAQLAVRDDSSAETVLAEQRSVEATMPDSLRDYRLLHLDVEGFGTLSDGDSQVSGIMRAAYYTSIDDVPLMMHQWAARHRGWEVTMTVTFAAADLPEWGMGSWGLAAAMTWKEGAA